jgi:hypothetical protein
VPRVCGPRSDPAVAYGVGDGLGTVAHVEPEHHVLDHVLDRALRIGQVPRHLPGGQSVRNEPEHVPRADGEPGERQAAWGEQVAAELAYMVEKLADEFGRQVDWMARTRRSAVASARRKTPRTPESASGTSARGSTRPMMSTIGRPASA